MAKRRRVAGRHTHVGLPGWIWPWIMLITGLILGWAAYYVYVHRPKPKPVQPAITQRAPHAVVPKRSHYDFYAMLPELETVLPRRHPARTQRQAPPSAHPPRGDHYELQAASYSDFADANHLTAHLALRGLSAYIQKVSVQGRGVFYRVRVGPYYSLAALNRADQKLASLGIRALRLDVHPLPRGR
ncbi:MAG: SPOR domain-containing protein [Acidiferrobacteraceae bacterium]